MRHYHISGVPIVEHERVAGILTNRDIRFIEERDEDDPIDRWMTHPPLVTVWEATRTLAVVVAVSESAKTGRPAAVRLPDGAES